MPESNLIIETLANGWSVRPPHNWGEGNIRPGNSNSYVFETLAALQLALPALLEKPKHLRNPLIDEP
jgi:hypothetical protein